jgi:hypothetical protein
MGDRLIFYLEISISLICYGCGRDKIFFMAETGDMGKAFVERVNAKPLDVDFFIHLLSVALSAIRGQRRQIPPDDERCLEDAPPGVIYAADVPMNQMAFSVMSECHQKFPDSDDEADDTSFTDP